MLSRHKPILFLIAALAILAGGLFLLEERPTSVEVPIPKQSPNKKLFLGKRTKTFQEIPQDPCAILKSTLEEIDFNERPSDLKKELFVACLDPDFESRKNLVLENCFPKVKNECQSHLMFLRSIMRTRGVMDADDRETIADLILVEFSKKDPDFKKLEKLVKKLLRDDPKNPAYQRMWAMAKFIGSGDPKNQREGLRDDIFSQLDPEIMNAQDMDGLRIFLETGLDPMKVEQMSRSLITMDPNRLGSHEILGWSLWQQGRRDEALHELGISVARNPHDEWLRNMYRNLQKPEATNEDYMGRLSLGVKLEDIFN